MGITKRNENSNNLVTVRKKLEQNVNYQVGSVNKECNVFGTYLHGIFDDIDFTRTILNNIRKMKNLEPIESNVKSFAEFKNQQYDKLADYLREHLDMKKIYEIMNDSDN